MEKWVMANRAGYEHVMVSNYGRLKSLPRYLYRGGNKKKRYRMFKPGVILKISYSNKGYARHSTPQSGTLLVHRIVYEAFNGPIKKGLTINHIDCNKANNKLSNLEAITMGENLKHAYRMGRIPRDKIGTRGDKNWNSKYTWSLINRIRRSFKNGNTNKYISKKYGMPISTVQHINAYRCWKSK